MNRWVNKYQQQNWNEKKKKHIKELNMLQLRWKDLRSSLKKINTLDLETVPTGSDVRIVSTQ